MSSIFSAVSSSKMPSALSSIAKDEVTLSLNEFARLIISQGSYIFRNGTTTTITGTNGQLTWRALITCPSIKAIEAIFADALIPFGYGVLKNFDSVSRYSFTTGSDNSSLTIKPTFGAEIVVVPARSNLTTTIPNLFKRMIASENLTLHVAPLQSLQFHDIPKCDLEELKTLPLLLQYLSFHMPNTIQNVLISTDDPDIAVEDTYSGKLIVVARTGFSLTLVPFPLSVS